MKTILAVILAGWVMVAQALMVDWEGDCVSGCDGKAVSTLAFSQFYTPGQSFDEYDGWDLFKWISYTDNMWDHTLTSFNFIGHGTAAGDSFSELSWCHSSCFDFRFRSLEDGTWNVRFEGPPVDADLFMYVAQGVNGTFTARSVPEPSTWALLLLGCLFLNLAAHTGGLRNFKSR